MSALDLARWQFGITTVYHFIFVPLTIGLAPLVAIMQTAWYRTGNEHWLRMTKFFGKLFLINFAMGIVTGIVQEFQFGMNWSEYSAFVGDIFGAPLAMEALIAFFLESTFLGLWIFGWDKLSKRTHLVTIWLAAIGMDLSAYFILAANSFMQHPFGVSYNPETKRAELDSIIDVLTNNTVLAAFPHTVTASFVTAATLVTAISGWWMVKHAAAGNTAEAAAYRPALRLGIIVILLGTIGVGLSGDYQAQLMFKQQPMKMAAAEALCTTETGVHFSILSIGDLSNSCGTDGENITTPLSVPNLTSIMADHDPNATLKGVNELQAEYAAKYDSKYGAGTNYIPNLMLTYWNFRLMIGFLGGSVLLALAGWWLTRKGASPDKAWFGKLALIALPTPYLANMTGWIFTEMGRQPWIVAPNPTGDPEVHLATAKAVSPYVDIPSVAVSLIVFTLLYGSLAVVWFKLMSRYAKQGAPVVASTSSDDDDAPLAFAY